MASAAEFVIEKLTKTNEPDRFDCGNDALKLWLKRFAWTNVNNDSARVYVVHRDDNVVLGYHAITVGSVNREDASPRISKGLAAHPIGVAILGRLALDAIRAVPIHTINEQARNFYLRFAFNPSPVDEMRWMLFMKDLRAFLVSRSCK